jgi:hypothetical protein
MMRQFAVSFGLIVAIAGCGSEPAYQGATRYALSGKVTLDGAPLEAGTISFIADGHQGNPAGGPVVKGEYAVDADRGANAGNYRVEVRWQKPTGQQVKDEDTGGMVDVTQEAIPAQYNAQSTLKAEVKPDKTKFDFDLKSK